jgi:SAM-dependent methyltransferase
MSVEVLATSSENVQARAEMRRLGIDFACPLPLRVLRKIRLVKGVSIGDIRKSWDVLKTIQFVEGKVSKSSPILDVGAYASEILCILYKQGFSDLTGIDFNPKLAQMPHAGVIKYQSCDFTQTRLPSEAFEVITAISVLEHGFCGPNILREVSRLLRPGGYFVGSIDYWPEKIDTSGIMAFGTDWRIFSRDELESFIQEARSFGMVPVGQLNLKVSETTVSWLRRRYTFAWFALQKISDAGTNSTSVH